MQIYIFCLVSFSLPITSIISYHHLFSQNRKHLMKIAQIYVNILLY
jgi:hypothetical protein